MTIKAKKSLGQNFINDVNLLNKIVKCAGILEGYNVIEIGPGTGNLTKAILSMNPTSLLSVEKDERCADLLHQLALQHANYKFLIQDALRMDERKLIHPPVKLISNLPYNISTILLIKWLDYIEFFTSLTLTFQKEVAERLMAKKNTKSYGKLSVLVQLYCQVKYNFDIPNSCFVPVPKITSSVVTLTPHLNKLSVNKQNLKKVLNVVFSQRRKMLSNSLKALCADPFQLLSKVDIKGTARPEDLTVEDYCKLANVL